MSVECQLGPLHPRTNIAGVCFSCIDREEAAKQLVTMATSFSGGYVCVTGAHGVVAAQDDENFKALLNSARINTLDGQPVVWIARARGFAKVGRVTGRELVWDVGDIDKGCEIHHVLFGSTQVVTDRMMERLRRRHEGIHVQALNPPFGPMNNAHFEAVCRLIKADEPTIVWIGLSTPNQEVIAARLSSLLPKVPIVAIGAGFDFVAGLKAVAPSMVTNLGIEWLFRLASEPRRLFRRYAEVIPKFLVLVVRAWRQRA